MLWPFAIKYAAHIHNNLSLNSHGKSPSERFLQTSATDSLDVSNFHTFGSPCYVLDPNEHTPKWDPRSSLRIFVGFSAHHARNVAMVLNPYTGLVSPQYHIVFDDHFQTLPGLRGTEIPDSWKNICKHNSTNSDDTDKRFTLPSEIVESGGDGSVPSVEDESLCHNGNHIMNVQIQYAPFNVKGGWENKKAECLAATLRSAVINLQTKNRLLGLVSMRMRACANKAQRWYQQQHKHYTTLPS